VSVRVAKRNRPKAIHSWLWKFESNVTMRKGMRAILKDVRAFGRFIIGR
jgi:hypothetical protein